MVLLGTQPALRHTLLFLVVTLSHRLEDKVRGAYRGVESTSRAENTSLRKGPKDMARFCTLVASYCCVITSLLITRRLLALFLHRLFKSLLRPLLFDLKKGRLDLSLDVSHNIFHGSGQFLALSVSRASERRA